MTNSRDVVQTVLSLVDANISSCEGIEELVYLPPPEAAFPAFPKRPPYAAIAVGAMKRLDQLMKQPEIVDQLPEISIKIGEEEYGPSTHIARRILLISLTYYSIYCLDHLAEEDEESVTDALGLAMRPSIFEIQETGDMLLFSLAVKHAITISAGAYWLHSFSVPARGATILQHHFLRPIAKSAAVLLSVSGLLDPVLNWGVSLLSRYAGRIVLKCTNTVQEQELLDYISLESHVNTSRLVRLAENNEKLQEVLGARLYTEFEEQLVRLFQSFGYLVSHTQPGQQRVDLVVATPPPCAYTFLIEAKSSKSAYSLPTSDQRALREYISTYRQANLTLPHLKFMIIVSSTPSTTLEKKLISLSSSEGISVRFIAAKDLAYLRHNIAGAIPAKVLLDSIASSSPILGKSWLDDIIKKASNHNTLFNMTVKNVFGELQVEALPWSSSGTVVITRKKG
jgi:hypothetical protein